jgi:hypothetical protein
MFVPALDAHPHPITRFNVAHDTSVLLILSVSSRTVAIVAAEQTVKQAPQ